TQVNVTAGTLNANNATALGSLAAVDVAAGGTLNLAAGTNPTLGSLSDAGNVVLNGNTLTVGTSNNLSGSFSGVLSDGSAPGNLAKGGTGSLTLAGPSTYTGTTTVLSGTLLLGANAPSAAPGALGNATSAVLVGAASGSASAALLTAGAFTVGRDVTFQSGTSGALTVGSNSTAAAAAV